MTMFVVVAVDERGHERFRVGEAGGVAWQAAAVLDLLVLVQQNLLAVGITDPVRRDQRRPGHGIASFSTLE